MAVPYLIGDVLPHAVETLMDLSEKTVFIGINYDKISFAALTSAPSGAPW